MSGPRETNWAPASPPAHRARFGARDRRAGQGASRPRALALALPFLALPFLVATAQAPPPVFPRMPVDTPFSSHAYGIPGRDRTCIKACEFDDNPCDPPVFKQADGRCSGQG